MKTEIKNLKRRIRQKDKQLEELRLMAQRNNWKKDLPGGPLPTTAPQPPAPAPPPVPSSSLPPLSTATPMAMSAELKMQQPPPLASKTGASSDSFSKEIVEKLSRISVPLPVANTGSTGATGEDAKKNRALSHRAGELPQGNVRAVEAGVEKGTAGKGQSKRNDMVRCPKCRTVLLVPSNQGIIECGKCGSHMRIPAGIVGNPYFSGVAHPPPPSFARKRAINLVDDHPEKKQRIKHSTPKAVNNTAASLGMDVQPMRGQAYFHNKDAKGVRGTRQRAQGSIIRQPRGRPPLGKRWDAKLGRWVDNQSIIRVREEIRRMGGIHSVMRETNVIPATHASSHLSSLPVLPNHHSSSAHVLPTSRASRGVHLIPTNDTPDSHKSPPEHPAGLVGPEPEIELEGDVGPSVEDISPGPEVGPEEAGPPELEEDMDAGPPGP